MNKKPAGSARARFLGRIRTRFFSGLFVVVPVVATVWILIWALRTADDFLQPILQIILGRNIPGLGLAVALIVILFVGILAHNFAGRKLIQLGDAVLKRIPIFKQIYNGIKQVMDSFSGTGSINRTAFREVVIIGFPARYLHTIAFITNEYTDSDGHKFYAVYIPTSPVPWSGYSAIIAEEDVTRSNISVDEALKMCISGLMITPPQLQICHNDQTITLNIKQKTITEAEEPLKK